MFHVRQSLIFPKALQDGLGKVFIYVVLVAFGLDRSGQINVVCMVLLVQMKQSVWTSSYFSDALVCTSFITFFIEKLNNAELPPKRTILKKDFEYLSSIRLKLQEYLQVKHL